MNEHRTYSEKAKRHEAPGSLSNSRHSTYLPSFVSPQLNVVSVPSSNRWQEISARRMELIQTLIEEKLLNNADYIFCLDVDSLFKGHWGAETLGHLVAVIHPGMDSCPTDMIHMYSYKVPLVGILGKYPHQCQETSSLSRSNIPINLKMDL